MLLGWIDRRELGGLGSGKHRSGSFIYVPVRARGEKDDGATYVSRGDGSGAAHMAARQWVAAPPRGARSGWVGPVRGEAGDVRSGDAEDTLPRARANRKATRGDGGGRCVRPGNDVCVAGPGFLLRPTGMVWFLHGTHRPMAVVYLFFFFFLERNRFGRWSIPTHRPPASCRKAAAQWRGATRRAS